MKIINSNYILVIVASMCCVIAHAMQLPVEQFSTKIEDDFRKCVQTCNFAGQAQINDPRLRLKYEAAHKRCLKSCENDRKYYGNKEIRDEARRAHQRATLTPFGYYRARVNEFFDGPDGRAGCGE